MQERLNIFLQMALVVAITLVVVAQLPIVNDAENEPSRTEQIIDSRLNGGRLEVLPSSGQPGPLDQPLQSSNNTTDQRASGSLQQPQTDNVQEQDDQNLQPGATVEDLPDDFEF